MYKQWLNTIVIVISAASKDSYSVLVLVLFNLPVKVRFQNLVASENNLFCCHAIL